MDLGSGIKDWKSRILHLVNISLIPVIIAKISFIYPKSLRYSQAFYILIYTYISLFPPSLSVHSDGYALNVDVGRRRWHLLSKCILLYPYCTVLFTATLYVLYCTLLYHPVTLYTILNTTENNWPLPLVHFMDSIKSHR